MGGGQARKVEKKKKASPFPVVFFPLSTKYVLGTLMSNTKAEKFAETLPFQLIEKNNQYNVLLVGLPI